MEDVALTQTADDTYTLQLCIVLQMELGLYVTPVSGQPETYESEEKLYTKTAEELQQLVAVALEAVKKYKDAAKHCETFEELNLTHRTVTWLLTSDGDIADDVSDMPYIADEDLMFQYGMLHILYEFIFTVRITLD